MYTPKELTALARAYLAGGTLPASGLSLKIGRHARFIEALFEGRDVRSGSVEAASDWFDQNWPLTVEWPKSVPRRKPVEEVVAAGPIADLEPRSRGPINYP